MKGIVGVVREKEGWQYIFDFTVQGWGQEVDGWVDGCR